MSRPLHLLHCVPKPLSIPYNKLVFAKHLTYEFILYCSVCSSQNLRFKGFVLLFIVALVLITTSFLNCVPDKREVCGTA